MIASDVIGSDVFRSDVIGSNVIGRDSIGSNLIVHATEYSDSAEGCDAIKVCAQVSLVTNVTTFEHCSFASSRILGAALLDTNVKSHLKFALRLITNY